MSPNFPKLLLVMVMAIKTLTMTMAALPLCCSERREMKDTEGTYRKPGQDPVAAHEDSTIF